MVACNPRDREAAHRAEVEGIATHNPQAVTCKKCWTVIRRLGVMRPSKKHKEEQGEAHEQENRFSDGPVAVPSLEGGP